jgi:hypothetical protein
VAGEQTEGAGQEKTVTEQEWLNPGFERAVR